MRNKVALVTRSIAGAIVLLVLVSSSMAADFTLRDWQYFKPIAPPSNLLSEGLVELVPDREVYAGSAPGLVDLRILAADATEVPYKLQVSRGERQFTSFPVTLRDKGYVPDFYTTFIADLGRDGLLHNEIEFQIRAINFRRTATVETSNDGGTWTKVGEQEVYDFTVKERNFSASNTRVSYTASTARYVRVKISDEGEGPIEVSGATLFFIKETPAQEVSWPVSIVGTSRNTDRRTTLVELDLGSPGLPSHRVQIRVSEVNFYREVTIEESADRKEWSTVQSRAGIYAYDTPRFVGSNLAVGYREATSRYVRLVIHDEDSPPLHIQGVDVWGYRRSLLYTADPEQSYELYYGNVDARRPSYDIERVFPYLETEELAQATLGPQNTNPDYVEKKPPVSERFPWLLPAVLGVVAIVVALLLLGVIRQARKVLPPPAQ